jgi:putative membrane protein
MTLDKTFKLRISIFIIWLFTLSGIIGVLSVYEDWFLSLTPLSLLLSFIMVLWHVESYNNKLILAIAIPFILGFITEALGVNYGFIFGDYAYGENLGIKIAGVPILICINWALLTMATADAAKLVSKNIIIASLIGASLMTGLDIILEVSAPRFDFWEFENGVVPIQNYIGWLVTAFVAHLGYQSFKIKTNKVISIHVLTSIIVFFAVFLFF